jgi:hypothetical protein
MNIERDRYRAALHSDGILYVEMFGLMSRADVDQYYPDLAPFDAAMRASHGRVRTLVDVQMVQPPGVAMYFRQKGISGLNPTDRCAFLVATMLSKLQIARLAIDENVGLFTDREKALAWLRE